MKGLIRRNKKVFIFISSLVLFLVGAGVVQEILKNVKPFEDVIDGAIVGSRFIKLLEESNFSTEAVKDYIKKFKEEM